MKPVRIPIEVPFRVFVGITFAGSIAFHLLGLGIHTSIAHQKTRLVQEIETLAEVRSQVMGVIANLSLVKERAGRDRNMTGVPPGGTRPVSRFSGEGVVTLMLGIPGLTGPSGTDPSLLPAWARITGRLQACRSAFRPPPEGCFRPLLPLLSSFLVRLDRTRDRVTETLVRVERHHADLERWDTSLYWITTVLGLLFMAMGWRNVLVQVGDPIQDVAEALKTPHKEAHSRHTSGPALFAIKKLRILKESMASASGEAGEAVLPRSAISGILVREISQALRNGSELPVVLLVPHRAGGATMGDPVAPDVVRALCRSSDWLGRWQGDSYLLVCPGLGKDQANGWMENLRKRAKNLAHGTANEGSGLTVEIGTAFMPPEKDYVGLIQTAEKALSLSRDLGEGPGGPS